MTLASIVIPSRGGASRLPRLLNALAAQDDPKWEAIVVVDGDVDGSEQVLARYQHLPVRAIVFPENRGRVAALNAGFEAADGDVLIRCDDDLEPGTGYVRLHKAAHSDSPGGAIGLPLNVSAVTPYWRVYGQPTDQRFRSQAYATDPAKQWRYWGGNVSVTRPVHEAVGAYSADYRAYGFEDVDYGYRIHQAGYPVRLVENLETPHHMAAVTTRIRSNRAFHSGAARRIFEARHGVGVLGDPTDLDPSAWNRLVLGLGGALNAPLVQMLAALADAAARLLPSPVARKLVALTVESAALAGYRNAHQVSLEV
ncbi:glycosyltransferase [Tessaracoccus sp. MC1627]|uniref:glycosyltransferase family 2 protein n=1 Tax=Tessaracoccus sp. MC1627 TaxID=2760312 RepID=UPI00160205F7|nr:glycosyltransferase family A protein [Tessaracoccus sp. MC1627]MBB1513186.1 glycosyltransferase [Tessaracoccus sp. MC1627]MBB1513481.1 glycosyltransferase [Tessaracoccus sp. MC1627]